MNGKQALIEKIIFDAQRIANATSEEGSANAQEIIAAAENDAAIYREKNRFESETERGDIIRRRISAANLAVKKLTLAAKQSFIGRVFYDAVREIREDKRYPEYLKGLLRFASDGDTVIICAPDKSALTKKYVSDYAKLKNIKLEYRCDGGFSGGMIISGEGADKNITLEAELAAAREELEAAIAEMMFGEDR